MKMWVYFLFLSLSIPYARGTPWDGWNAAFPNSFPDALEQIKALDPAPNAEWRETIPGGYRTKLGLQLDESCIKLIEDKNKMEIGDKEEALRNLENSIQEASTSILRCQARYPELTPYIQSWAHESRRIKISCIDESFEEFGYGGINYGGGSITLPRDTFRGLLLKIKSQESNIFNDPNTEYSRSTLIHEIFHSTLAEGQEANEHNRIEKIHAGAYWDDECIGENCKPIDSCGENAAMDRVSVLESLCSNTRLNGQKSDQETYKKEAAYRIFERMNTCGKERGCEDLFTGEATIGSFFTPFYFLFKNKKDLDQKTSSQLCKKIKEDGFCLQTIVESGPNFMNSLPQVKAVQEKIRERILKIFPTSLNQIPGALLDLYPELKKELIELKDDACFEAALSMGKDGTIFARDRSYARLPKDNNHNDPFDAMRDLLHTYYYFLKQVKKVTEDSPRCKELGNPKKLIEVLSKFREASGKDDDIGVRMFFMRFAMGDPTYAPYLKADFDHDSDKENTPNGLYKLLGEDLINEFFEVNRKFHFRSPDFDCEAAGLSPFRTAERTDIMLKKMADLHKNLTREYQCDP